MYSQLPVLTVLLTLSGGTDTEQIQKKQGNAFLQSSMPASRDLTRDGWIKEFIKFWAVLGSRGYFE